MTMSFNLNALNALTDDRADPDSRSVLEDAELSMGGHPTRIGLVIQEIQDATDDGVNDDAADAVDADETNDTTPNVTTFTDAVDDAVGEALTVDDDAVVDATPTKPTATDLLTQDPDMRNGLKIIQVPGSYGWAATLVGWFRRVAGDEWEMIGSRTVIRIDGMLPRTLASIAWHGPRDDHRMTDPEPGVEEVHRLVIRRSLPANLENWAQHCPRPDGWKDGE